MREMFENFVVSDVAESSDSSASWRASSHSASDLNLVLRFMSVFRSIRFSSDSCWSSFSSELLRPASALFLGTRFSGVLCKTSFSSQSDDRLKLPML